MAQPRPNLKIAMIGLFSDRGIIVIVKTNFLAGQLCSQAGPLRPASHEAQVPSLAAHVPPLAARFIEQFVEQLSRQSKPNLPGLQSDKYIADPGHRTSVTKVSDLSLWTEAFARLLLACAVASLAVFLAVLPVLAVLALRAAVGTCKSKFARASEIYP